MTKSTVPLKDVLARFSPESRARVEARAAELIAEELTLAELRKAQKLTQQAVAKLLGIKQESVSNIETRADMLLSTLRGYVEAMGGELSLQVEFPDRAPVKLASIATERRKMRISKPARRAGRSPASRGRKAAGRVRSILHAPSGRNFMAACGQLTSESQKLRAKEPLTMEFS